MVGCLNYLWLPKDQPKLKIYRDFNYPFCKDTCQHDCLSWTMTEVFSRKIYRGITNFVNSNARSVLTVLYIYIEKYLFVFLFKQSYCLLMISVRPDLDVCICVPDSGNQ